MPGLDLEEWQTQEVNVNRGEAEGDIDLEGLPFLCYSRQFYIHYFYPKPLVFVGDNTTRSITIYLY